jgi:hypothetical protein
LDCKVDLEGTGGSKLAGLTSEVICQGSTTEGLKAPQFPPQLLPMARDTSLGLADSSKHACIALVERELCITDWRYVTVDLALFMFDAHFLEPLTVVMVLIR